jgi:rRNA maturation endonuclease Nob1
MGKFDSHVDKGILVGYSSTRKAYKFFNLRLNKVVERINVTVDEIGGHKIKEEEKESVEQVYEEEAKDEEVTEGEYEEDQIEVEEKEQKVPPKTPSKQIQRIIPQIRLSGTKMQELRLEEEFIHQNNCT